MNILVGISRVPDTATKVAIDESGTAISAKGVKYIVNPYDEYAIEEALQLKQKHGGTVTAVTVADDGGKETLRSALAMGVDKAILVKDEQGLDSFGIAATLSELAGQDYDLVLLGRQSIDFDSFQMAGLLGELLGRPSLTVVSKLEIDGQTVKAERDIEGGKESVTSSLPCVISVQKGINDPRYPKLPDIIKAKKKPIEERAAQNLPARVTVTRMEMPPAKSGGVVLGDTADDIKELVRLLREDAKVI